MPIQGRPDGTAPYGGIAKLQLTGNIDLGLHDLAITSDGAKYKSSMISIPTGGRPRLPVG